MKKWIRCWARFVVVLLLPEPVPGERRGHQAAGQQRRREPREPAEREHQPGADLHRAVDPDQLLGVLRQVRQLRRDRRRDLVGGGHLARGVPERVEPSGDEHGGEAGTGESAYEGHGRSLPEAGGDQSWHRRSSSYTSGRLAAVCGRYAASANPDDLVEEFEVDERPEQVLEPS